MVTGTLALARLRDIRGTESRAGVRLRTPLPVSRFSWTGSVAGVGVGLLMLLMAGGVRASTLIALTVPTGDS